MSTDERAMDDRRVYWHSRRGMVELDVLLMPYALEVYPSLDDSERERFKRLLACEDADLFAWFMGHAEPDNSELTEVIGKVLAHGRANPEGADSG